MSHQQQTSSRSPFELRESDGANDLETYHPRLLSRQLQIPVEGAEDNNSNDINNNNQSNAYPTGGQQQQQHQQKQLSNKITWLSKLTSPKAQRNKLDRMRKLASLDSTKSSSSMELDPLTGELVQLNHSQTSAGSSSILRPHLSAPPLISITSNDNNSNLQQLHQQQVSERSIHSDYYGRPGLSRRQQQRQLSQSSSRNKRGYQTFEDDDEDDDEYGDDYYESQLPIPYSSSSMSRSNIVNLQESNSNRNTNESKNSISLEELLDDRQGMNSSEMQFTKGEKATRPSIDGSVISESYSSRAKITTKSSSLTSRGKDGNKRRSKSPSSSSVGAANRRSRRESRRGIFGLASRLKLTKKHESIAKLQLSILNSGFVSLKTLDRDLQSFLPRERMSIKDFEERVKLMRKYKVLANIEYRFASRYETYVCRYATQESNQVKNNYKKCIPYDYNRVVLRTLPNVSDSDYINASHVDSCLKPNAYIAAQGPNENTIEDFWRMIWEQKTFVIVMLTKVFDFIRVMCNQYWPLELNKPERYGNLEVTLLFEEPLADFVIRTIKLRRLRGKDQQVKPEQDGGQAGTNIGGINNNDSTTGDAIPTSGKRSSSSNIQLHNGDSPSENDFEFTEDDSAYTDDETSASEELILNPRRQSSELDLSGRANVREPKYLSVNSRGSAGRSGSSRNNRQQRRSNSSARLSMGSNGFGRQSYNLDPTIDHLSSRLLSADLSASGAGSSMARQNLARSSSQPPPSRARKISSTSQQQQQKKQEQQVFTPDRSLNQLHPLSYLSRSALDGSSGSLNNLSEPATPVTPRTPSSAGLDRSSATRRAVKKKRRVREKNTRPRRTQFMVPSESQLLDDDDEGDDDRGKDDNYLISDNQLNSTDLDLEPQTPDGLLTGDEEMNDLTGSGRPAASSSRSNERIIYQFHYNSWASHTCPFISSLLHFRRRVRICMDEMSKSGKTGPTVVHCNDGCGRTGTYLCIDANLELAEEDNVLDVFNYTKKMRQSRKFLIENLEQYKFVYDTIEEAMFCGKTWFPVAELHKQLKHKSRRNPTTKKNEYQREYEKITRMTSKFSIGDCAGGHRVENREKNRDVSTVPPDNFRPYLTSFQTNDSTDYINAVFVDGYTRSKEYIVTEWPLHRTISDFWSLVYDHDCNSVILLANPLESSTYPSFLPSEKELRRKFGPVFSAEMVSYTHYPNIKSWIYTINKKIVSLTEVIAGVRSEAKTTQVFQITCWPQGHRVPTSTNALVELMNMVERWRQRTTYGPVCVVSLNGKSRAGVYCAANVAIEQVVQHSEVDVFQAVKTVRRHRPQLIENMTEYKYCYDLILHYVLHYVNQTPATS